MYLPNMTNDEIRQTMRRELYDCRKRAVHLYNDSLRRAKKAHSRKQGLTSAMYWKNPKTMSEYIILVVFETKAQLRGDQAFAYFPIFRDSNNSIHLLSSNHYQYEIFEFTPHFFDRYKERMQLDISERTTLLERFLSANWRMAINTVEKQRHGNTEREVKFPEGVGMIQINEDSGRMFVRTFIRHDMCYDAQRTRLEDLHLSSIEEIYTINKIRKYLCDYNVW